MLFKILGATITALLATPSQCHDATTPLGPMIVNAVAQGSPGTTPDWTMANMFMMVSQSVLEIHTHVGFDGNYTSG